MRTSANLYVIFFVSHVVINLASLCGKSENESIEWLQAIASCRGGLLCERPICTEGNVFQSKPVQGGHIFKTLNSLSFP